MSRVANNPVSVPAGVEIKLDARITVKGPLGTLSESNNPAVKVSIEDGSMRFAAAEGSQFSRAMSGTMRALCANMVHGVTQGFERRLNLVGVGYRAQAKGSTLSLALGFSHPVEFAMPQDVQVETPTPTEIVLKSISKQQVGQVAAKIRALRPPEPYKGKGVRYANETVLIKETKKK